MILKFAQFVKMPPCCSTNALWYISRYLNARTSCLHHSRRKVWLFNHHRGSIVKGVWQDFVNIVDWICQLGFERERVPLFNRRDSSR